MDNSLFISAANEMGLEPALLKSLILVECGANAEGFLPSGRPKILFEGHIFWKELEKVGINPNKYSHKYRDVLYEKWDKSKYLGGESEWSRLRMASEINQEAALKSASWGLGQIMGFNYNLAGCDTIEIFVNKNNESHKAQMWLLYNFLDNSRLIPLLKEHKWDEFAKKYNGPGQVKYYSQKFENTYRNLKGKL
jgi:hypothetical protein|nr:MAG TPA: N acetylmuramidase [Caudoviricetes sp.]